MDSVLFTQEATYPPPPQTSFGPEAYSTIVTGTVLLQRGEPSLLALAGLRNKIRALSNALLPHGMRIDTIYDRTDLIKTTTETVRRPALEKFNFRVADNSLALGTPANHSIVMTIFPL